MNGQRYLDLIIVLLLGVILLAGIVLWYDSREESLAREDDNLKIERTEFRDSLERLFTGRRTTVSEERTVIVRDQELNAAAKAARHALAVRLGIPESSIIVTSVVREDWPNSCLGLEQSGEMCLQVITPGFEVTMEAQGRTYVYRTNMDGSIVRAAN